MFDNCISIRSINTNTGVFSKLLTDLSVTFPIRDPLHTGLITSQTDFPGLYEITKPLYQSTIPDIFSDFVPLYHSLWRHTTVSACGPGNLHQDGGVHHFSKKSYKSRMINIWICLLKSTHSSLPPDELGLCVVENRFPENRLLYEKLITLNTHVIAKSPKTLIDNMHIAGPVLDCDLDNLKQTMFPYAEGTMITFSSHLLHGSKRHAVSTPSGGEDYSRIALTSVWLHKDDLDFGVLEMPEEEYESMYLSHCDRSLWPDLKQNFHKPCETESKRIASIKALVKLHLGLQ